MQDTPLKQAGGQEGRILALAHQIAEAQRTVDITLRNHLWGHQDDIFDWGPLILRDDLCESLKWLIFPEEPCQQ